MAVQFYLTDVGKNEAINANNSGFNVVINKLIVGTGKFSPETESAGKISLLSQVGEYPTTGGKILKDEYGNKNLQLTVEITPDNTVDIYEMGVMTEQGNLFAVASTTGDEPLLRLMNDITTIVTFALKLDNASANVEVKIDNTEAIALKVLRDHENNKSAGLHDQYALASVVQALSSEIANLKRGTIEDIPIGGLFITTADYQTSSEVRAVKGYGRWEKYGDGKVLVAQGTTGGLPNWTKTIGTAFGEYEHQLTIDEMPRHNHTPEKYKDKAIVFNDDWGCDGNRRGQKITSDYNLKMLDMGGDQPHNNVQPSIVVGIWKRLVDTVGIYIEYFAFGCVSGNNKLTDGINYDYYGSVIDTKSIAQFTPPQGVKISLMQYDQSNYWLLLTYVEWDDERGYTETQKAYSGYVNLTNTGESKKGEAQIFGTKIGSYKRRYTAYIFNREPASLPAQLNDAVIKGYVGVHRVCSGFDRSGKYIDNFSTNSATSKWYTISGSYINQNGVLEYVGLKEDSSQFIELSGLGGNFTASALSTNERPVAFSWSNSESLRNGAVRGDGVAIIKARIVKNTGDSTTTDYKQTVLKEVTKFVPFYDSMFEQDISNIHFALPFCDEKLTYQVQDGTVTFDEIEYSVAIYEGFAEDILPKVNSDEIQAKATYELTCTPKQEDTTQINSVGHRCGSLCEVYLSSGLATSDWKQGNFALRKQSSASGDRNNPVSQKLNKIFMLDYMRLYEINTINNERRNIYYKLFSGYVNKQTTGNLQTVAGMEVFQSQNGTFTKDNDMDEIINRLQVPHFKTNHYFYSDIASDTHPTPVADKLVVYVLFVLGFDRNLADSDFLTLWNNPNIHRINVYASY